MVQWYKCSAEGLSICDQYLPTSYWMSPYTAILTINKNVLNALLNKSRVIVSHCMGTTLFSVTTNSLSSNSEVCKDHH